MHPTIWSLFLVCSAGFLTGVRFADEPRPARPSLEMSKAIVCKKVVGFEDYVELPDASLTSEDKLNVYFRPIHFRVAPVEKPKPGSRYKSSFVEDCRIRRKGEKTVLMKKDKMVEYDPTFERFDQELFLVNNISLKGLSPGDYELDIVLHDLLEKDATTTQTVTFTVIPTPKVEPAKDEGTTEPESPPVPKTPAKAPKKKPKMS